MPPDKITISHIGSTAVKGIWAKQYEELKISLWKKFEHDRDGYTLAKTSFIVEQTEKAKQHYGHRY